MKTVTAAEANRNFSKLLREVAEGETVVITSHGRSIANLVPLQGEETERARKAAALQKFIELGRLNPMPDFPKWTREELYGDESYPDTL